jgi:hypothetical protein
MVNPSLGIALLDRDTLLKDNSVKAVLKYAQLGNFRLQFGPGFISSFRLPIPLDDSNSTLTLYYDKAMRLNDTIRVDIKILQDTIGVNDTLEYAGIIDLDTLKFLDSICISPMDCRDTLLHVIRITLADTVETKDTAYLTDFTQSFIMKYKPELVPVSPQCGFIYQFKIDTLLPQVTDHMDTVVVNTKLVEIPIDIYEKEPNHIYIYF